MLPVNSLAGYLRSNETVRDEVAALLNVEEGALPSGLRGLLCRNGLGRMAAYGTRYRHPFNGDGRVTICLRW